jgi:peroxiredoxin
MDHQAKPPPTETLAVRLTSTDGVERSVTDALATGPVLLAIYKSSCAASKVMLPMLGRIAARHAADGLTTLGVAQDSENITRSFGRRYEIDYPLLIETPEFPLSHGFGIQFTPSVFVLRQDGTVAYTTMGFMRGQIDEIEAAVATELGVEPVPIIRAEEVEIPFFVPG